MMIMGCNGGQGRRPEDVALGGVVMLAIVLCYLVFVAARFIECDDPTRARRPIDAAVPVEVSYQ